MTAKGAVLWHVVLIGTLGGGLFGCHIGYAGVTMQFNNYLGNCTRYETPQACGGVSAVCEWYVNPLDASQQECAFKDQLIANKAVAPVVIYNGCDLHASGDACTDIPHCEHQDNACYHETEWNSNDRGLFSGMMIVGAMFSSIPAGSLLNRFGRKKVISAAGALAVLTGVLLILGWAHDSDGQLGTFALLSAARFIAGVSVGIISVASPMYVGEMAGDLKWPGMLFQISCTLGIFLMALIGFLIHKEGEDLKTDDGLKGKFQVLNGILTAIAVLYTVLGFVINEPATSDDESKPLQGGAEVVKIPWSEMKVPIISAVALSAAQQLTGINAIMNYAPALSSNFGFKPLEGNMIIMLWNFVTTIASLKLSSMMKPTKMFIIFAYIASVACLVTGIPTFPSVFPDGNTTGQVLSAAGIVIFIAAFEMGMGPCFYVLAQSLFPASRRSEGCSFTLVVQFVFNVIINWGYPVLVTVLSGGKNGNQRQGTAIMFLAFGVIGILCTFGLMLNVARQESTDEPDDE